MQLCFGSKESLGMVVQRGCVLIQDLPSLEDGWSVCTQRHDLFIISMTICYFGVNHVNIAMVMMVILECSSFQNHCTSAMIRTQLPHVLQLFHTELGSEFSDHVDLPARPGKKHMHILWLVQGDLSKLLYRLRQHRVRQDQPPT